MELGEFFRYKVNISGNFTLIKFDGISKLVKSNKFLRHRVDINGNLKLIDFSRFLRFYFGFRFRAVYYKAFLLIIGGGK